MGLVEVWFRFETILSFTGDATQRWRCPRRQVPKTLRRPPRSNDGCCRSSNLALAGTARHAAASVRDGDGRVRIGNGHLGLDLIRSATVLHAAEPRRRRPQADAV